MTYEVFDFSIPIVESATDTVREQVEAALPNLGFDIWNHYIGMIVEGTGTFTVEYEVKDANGNFLTDEFQSLPAYATIKGRIRRILTASTTTRAHAIFGGF